MVSRPRHWTWLTTFAFVAASSSVAAQTGDAAVAPTTARKQAQEIRQGDPARWYREDVTDAQRLRTRQKEIGAALSEAKHACRASPAAERAACMKTAQDTWKQEMASLRSAPGGARPQPGQ